MPRITIRTLLTVTAIVAFVLMSIGMYQRWYQQRFNYFNQMSFRSQVKNGDSVERVATHFDEFVPVFTVGPDLELVPVENAQTFGLTPARNSWKREAGDVCYFGVHYSSGRNLSKLVFREGMLVEWLQVNDAAAITERAGYPVPHVMMRLGLVPLLILVLVCMLFILGGIWSARRLLA